MTQTAWKVWVRLGVGTQGRFIEHMTIYDCSQKPDYHRATITLDADTVGSAPLAEAGGSMPTPSDPIRDALVEALEKMFAALNSDAKSGPQKTIRGDDTIYHLDGQAMYHAINACRAALSLSKAGR